MSIKQESQPSTPQPNKEFGKEWRKTPWQDKGSLEKNLRKFNVSHPDVKYIRLLVVGEVGAGKSSFINSVNNVFQGRITSGALVDATSGKSFTKAYKTHYIYREDGSCLPFVFNDIMGLEGPDGCGAPVEDIISALAGLVEEGYKFNPVSAKTTSTPNCTPSLGAQTYCLVNIIAADKVSRMDDKVIKKMKNIREKASGMDMPQVIIMTRVDEACPLVKDDIRKIYNSKKIKEKMQECSNHLGVPMNHIFPVKNYHEEIDPDNDIDVLILKALDQIVNIAKDALMIRIANTKSE